jgi:hypothetical protein
LARNWWQKWWKKMRNENRKIIPLCPFAKHEFDTTPEYADIRA